MQHRHCVWGFILIGLVGAGSADGASGHWRKGATEHYCTTPSMSAHVPLTPGSTLVEGRYFSLSNLDSGGQTHRLSASLEWTLPPEILRPGEVVPIVLRARLVENRTQFFWTAGINARIHPGVGWLVEEARWPKVDRGLPAGAVREERGTARMPEAGGGDFSLDVLMQGELVCTWSYRYAWQAGEPPVSEPTAGSGGEVGRTARGLEGKWVFGAGGESWTLTRIGADRYEARESGFGNARGVATVNGASFRLDFTFAGGSGYFLGTISPDGNSITTTRYHDMAKFRFVRSGATGGEP